MSKTILAIDDDPDTIRMLDQLLRQEGYDVRTAPSAQEGLRLLDERPPDLILLDLMMPGMDGFDFCHQLATSGRAKGIPIIVLTALDTFTYSEDFLAGLFGVCLFMYKPFKPSTLLANIHDALTVQRTAS
ncbi:MAG: response regulator [Planctomycetes bacterium]|nr:response regulator [Planctomycetota bacterium]